MKLLTLICQIPATHALDLNGNGAFDLGDLIIIGGVIGAGFAAIQGTTSALVKWGDRLWGRKKTKEDGKGSTDEMFGELISVLREIRERPMQPSPCNLQHVDLKDGIKEQSASIRELVQALREQIHADELRHQTIVLKLELLAKGQESLSLQILGARHGDAA